MNTIKESKVFLGDPWEGGAAGGRSTERSENLAGCGSSGIRRRGLTDSRTHGRGPSGGRPSLGGRDASVASGAWVPGCLGAWVPAAACRDPPGPATACGCKPARGGPAGASGAAARPPGAGLRGSCQPPGIWASLGWRGDPLWAINSVVECHLHTVEVTSSNLVSPIETRSKSGSVCVRGLESRVDHVGAVANRGLPPGARRVPDRLATPRPPDPPTRRRSAALVRASPGGYPRVVRSPGRPEKGSA